MMHCPDCQYALWNLRTRQCPECGREFRPSEFEFVPNAVCFCCPQCDQAYYGTGDRGHLDPQSFSCVSCGSAVTMDEMIVLPAEGVREAETAPARVPWEGPGGRFERWWRTVWSALMAPHRLLESTEHPGATARSWLFAAITMCIVTALTMFMSFGFAFALPLIAGAPPGPGVPYFAAIIAVMSVVGVVIGLIMIGLWGLTAHGLLRLTGETAGTLGRTQQAICYSSGANIATTVPCLGPYFGWLWWVVSAIFAIRSAQRVSGGRAALAALALPIGSLIVCVGSYIALIFVMLGVAQTFAPMGQMVMGQPANARICAQRVLAGLDAFERAAGAPDGRVPQHAAEMIAGGYIDGAQFTAADSGTMPHLVPWADQNLTALYGAPVDEQEAATEREIALLGADPVAHRFGDIVATWHGINRDRDPADLWLFIVWYDPAYNVGPSPDGSVIVVRNDRAVESMPEADFDEALKRQNERRAAENLPPLPHPREVRRRQRAN